MPSDHTVGGDISEKTEKTILVGLVVPTVPECGGANRIPGKIPKNVPKAIPHLWSYSIQNDS